MLTGKTRVGTLLGSPMFLVGWSQVAESTAAKDRQLRDPDRCANSDGWIQEPTGFGIRVGPPGGGVREGVRGGPGRTPRKPPGNPKKPGGWAGGLREASGGLRSPPEDFPGTPRDPPGRGVREGYPGNPVSGPPYQRLIKSQKVTFYSIPPGLRA